MHVNGRARRRSAADRSTRRRANVTRGRSFVSLAGALRATSLPWRHADRPAAACTTHDVGATVNESTTLTNRERRENVAFLGRLRSRPGRRQRRCWTGRARALRDRRTGRQNSRVLHAALLRSAGGPAGARSRRRRRLASPRRRPASSTRSSPASSTCALRPRPARLPQRQQGQDHRLHPSGRDPRHVAQPASAAPDPDVAVDVLHAASAARSSHAPSGSFARCAASALERRGARPLRLRAGRPRTQARGAHGLIDLPRRPTRSPT